MTGFDLSKNAKLPLIWIIPKCYYVEDLILDSVWIILVFYCNFCAFLIIFLHSNFLSFFLSENK